MGPSTVEVERALLALAPEERAEVIRAGFRSLDMESDDTTSRSVLGEWRAELERRVSDVAHGRVTVGSFEATRAKFERRESPSRE